jgi:hypothetical protein
MPLVRLKSNALLLNPSFCVNNVNFALFPLIFKFTNLKSLGICLVFTELLVLL